MFGYTYANTNPIMVLRSVFLNSVDSKSVGKLCLYAPGKQYLL